MFEFMKNSWVQLMLVAGLFSGAIRSFAEVHPVRVEAVSGSGFEGNAQIGDGFKNCYGDIVAGFSTSEYTPVSYRYNGKSYTPQDLGMNEFKPRKLGNATLSADLYLGQQSLGRVTVKNVIFFSAVGCFSETYGVIKMLGLKNEDYRKNYKELRFQNLTLESGDVSRALESKILELEKPIPSPTPEKIPTPAPFKAAPTGAPSVAPAVSIPSSAKSGSGSSAPRVVQQRPTAEDLAQQKAEKAAQLEVQKKAMADQAAKEMQEQLERDRRNMAEASAKLSDAAQGFASGIASSGTFLGGAMLPGNEVKLSGDPFNPLFVGLIIGKTRDPESSQNFNNWFSGAETFISWNVIDDDPTSVSRRVVAENVRKYDWFVDLKAYGNITRLGRWQPYVGIGLSSYTEYDPFLKYVDSGLAFPIGAGISFVSDRGFLRIGYNFTLKGWDFGLALQ